MAIPIELHRDRPDARKHAEAVESAYALLQELHDRGVLDLLRGLTAAGADIATALSDAAASPESIRLMRNLVSLGKILSAIDPEMLHNLANQLSRPAPPAGFWTTLRRLGSKDTRRALGAVAYGVHAFGRALLARKDRVRPNSSGR